MHYVYIGLICKIVFTYLDEKGIWNVHKASIAWLMVVVYVDMFLRIKPVLVWKIKDVKKVARIWSIHAI